MKCALIGAEKAECSIGFMCAPLGVSRSGYSAWEGRSPSPRARQSAELGDAVAAIYEQTKGRYGSPRIVRELRAQGRCTSRKRVARRMRDKGLVARHRTRFRRTTDSNHRFPIAENLLARNFATPAPNQVWVTDLTYIWTREGWLYLSAILDRYSRAVVGWAMSDRIDTELCRTALAMAVRTRRPPAGLVHHSDRGSTPAMNTARRSPSMGGSAA